jgi:DNA-binding HxlR family transcriptional regulator
MAGARKITLTPDARRSSCPLACTLELIGDKWTLLVIRDMFRGKSRFSEFLESPEGITTNILTERLNRLVTAGIVERSRYQERPPRYAYLLTDAGRGLDPVLRACLAWAEANIPNTAKVLATLDNTD